MKKIFFICMLVIAAAAPAAAFEFRSADFTDGDMLPAAITCDGAKTAPDLSWTRPPAGTKSFALICTDPDAPRGEFTHWVVYDIPATASGIPRGGRLPEGTRGFANDFGRQGFGAVCPPVGSGIHHYIFTLYALSVEKLSADSRSSFLDAVKKVQLGSVTLTGLYQRK